MNSHESRPAPPLPAGPADLKIFASGLGHELANLMAAARIRVQCLTDVCGPEAASSDLEALRAALDGVTGIASGLRCLALSAEEHECEERVPLDRWWLDVLPVLRSVVPRGVAFEGRISEGAGCLVTPGLITGITFQAVHLACKLADSEGGGRVGVRVSAPGPWLDVAISHRGVRGLAAEAWAELERGGMPGRVRRAGGEVTMGPGEAGEWRVMVRLPAGKAEAPAAPTRRAFVGVGDERKRALIVAELRALACDTTNDPAERLACDLEVVDAVAAVPVLPRNVVLLADPPPAGDGGRTLPIGRNPTARAIRETLRRVVLGSP